MQKQSHIRSKLIARKDIEAFSRKIHKKKNKIVFTNGVFDILHRGHVEYLQAARECGDCLIVGLNSDASVKRLKGKSRPLQSQNDRVIILSALSSVDYIVIFGEDTPWQLIEQIKPSVLVKGADYKIDEIVGADFVQSYGGKVKRIRLTPGRSTSKIFNMIQ